MAVDALAHHPSVAHYLRFVATTAGRDKLLRAVQYFARFYAWYLLRTNGTPAQMAPWQGLKRQLGLARKLLRVGKPVEHLQAPADAADAKAPAVPAFLRYAAYLALDGLALSDALGVVRWRRAPAAQRQAYRCWALTLVFSLAAQLYTLRRLARREAAINRKDGEGVVEGKRIKVERSASRLQLLCDLCDLTIPTSALGRAAFDDGFVGLAGTLSSVVGVYTQWKKVA